MRTSKKVKLVQCTLYMYANKLFVFLEERRHRNPQLLRKVGLAEHFFFYYLSRGIRKPADSVECSGLFLVRFFFQIVATPIGKLNKLFSSIFCKI